jgi:hypothetical protein
MFIDAQEVEENIKACGNFLDQVKDEEWNADIADNEHEQEVCYEKELAKHPVEEKDVVSNFFIYDLQEAFFYLYMMSTITIMRLISKKHQKYPFIQKMILFNSLIKEFNPFMTFMTFIIGKFVT